jgi:GAF domain-containing protein
MQQHVVAALNLYSQDVGAFAPPDVDVATDVAAQAAIAVANAILYESAV